MKKLIIFVQVSVILILINVSLDSCKKNKTITESSGAKILDEGDIGNGDQDYDIKENITLKKGIYTLKGWCYVKDGVTLTIEPGTIIKGDKATKASLIIERGGKIIAKGTATEPIVFTSGEPKGNRKPGDWGGLIILGKAKNNQNEMTIEGGPRAFHGGNDDNDNSGVLSYVRVEFAGYPYQTDQEINGITFGSVGRGTQVDHIQVSYSNDDSYEWFGGAVNCKYLVAYHGWDDDFDMDNGYTGRGQFFLGIRHPKIADASLSNGFEIDNNSNGSTAQPYTEPLVSNVTLIGAKTQATDFINNATYINAGALNPNNGSRLGIFQSAIQIRRNARLSCYNSVAIGYPVGIIIENDKGSTTQSAAGTAVMDGKFAIKNVLLGGYDILGSDMNKSFIDSATQNATRPFTEAPSFSNKYFTSIANNRQVNDISILFKQPNSMIQDPNYGPKSGSPLLNQIGLFDDIAYDFFTKVNYIGAFASDNDADNWTRNWCNFDPQNTDYSVTK